MKYVFRFIGFLVVILLIAALALYTLNSFGYLHGPLSKWINDVANHCQGTVNDTVDFIENQDILPITVRTHAPTQAPTTAQPQDSEPLQTPAPALSFAEP